MPSVLPEAAGPGPGRGSKVVIGWAEYVDLPEWRIRGLRAKVDTGARTSALHVDNIEDLGRGRIRFDVVLYRRKVDRRVTVVARVRRQSSVRSSTGATDVRYVVSTQLSLAGIEKTIDVSLASRGEMRFRMLLGRAALGSEFLVDVSRRYLAPRPPKRKKTSDHQSHRPEGEHA